MDGTPQIHFETLINPLGLTINLRIIGCAVQQLGAQLGENLLPHSTEKYSIPIRDNGRKEYHEGPLCPTNYGHLMSCKGVLKRKKVSLLSESIHHH